MQWSEGVPERCGSASAGRLAEARARVGREAPPDAWRRAVVARDPTTLLKRWYPHVNRCTFKMHEIAARLLEGRPAPRSAVFLAEAPGGFLACARGMWPDCDMACMSSEAPGAIAFSAPDDVSILRGLPFDSDLRSDAVERELVRRCGAAGADLVTADGGAHVDDLDSAEQVGTPLALAQASAALLLLAKGGALVLKVFEGCTLVTRQLFEVLRGQFDRTMLFKPTTSKPCNSERYVVALGLRDPLSARSAAGALRAACRGCAAPAAGGGGRGGGESDTPGAPSHPLLPSSSPPSLRYVSDLGVEVSDLTRTAFDRMADEQASAIHTLIGALRRPHSLRPLAVEEARAIEDILMVK
jgi:23S rRNA U2552 (ribose-2'-O)-methylase RlmE/FtsJ